MIAFKTKQACNPALYEPDCRPSVLFRFFPLHEGASSVQNAAVPGNGDYLPGNKLAAGLQRVLRRPL